MPAKQSFTVCAYSSERASVEKPRGLGFFYFFLPKVRRKLHELDVKKKTHPTMASILNKI
jgi:hypothetical protein